MTPESFRRWLADMQSAGLAASEAECARLLGITIETKRVLKHKGAPDQRTALACAALLHRLEPYGADRGGR